MYEEKGGTVAVLLYSETALLPRGPPLVPRHSPTVGSWEFFLSYERGIPVGGAVAAPLHSGSISLGPHRRPMPRVLGGS